MHSERTGVMRLGGRKAVVLAGILVVAAAGAAVALADETPSTPRNTPQLTTSENPVEPVTAPTPGTVRTETEVEDVDTPSSEPTASSGTATKLGTETSPLRSAQDDELDEQGEQGDEVVETNADEEVEVDEPEDDELDEQGEQEDGVVETNADEEVEVDEPENDGDGGGAGEIEEDDGSRAEGDD